MLFRGFALLSLFTLTQLAFADANVLEKCAQNGDSPCSVKIIASHSGKCVDVSGGGANGGIGVIQYFCKNDASKNQNWILKPAGDDTYLIVSVNSGMCLDIGASSAQAYVQPMQFPCHGTDNQRFHVIPVTDHTFALQAKHDGMCIDVLSGSQADWTPIIQFPCHYGANQQFELVLAK